MRCGFGGVGDCVPASCASTAKGRPCMCAGASPARAAAAAKPKPTGAAQLPPNTLGLIIDPSKAIVTIPASFVVRHSMPHAASWLSSP